MTERRKIVVLAYHINDLLEIADSFVLRYTDTARGDSLDNRVAITYFWNSSTLLWTAEIEIKE